MLAAAIQAQEPAPPAGLGPRRAFGGPEFEKTREAFKQLSPEERQRWIENFRRWEALPPEQKKNLLDRQEAFHKRMREDVEAAIKDSGLDLNEEQRKLFAARYTEERRKIEEEIRKQMEEVRRPRVKELVERLKQEFSATAPK
jgi:TRAP-type C4-dicarboxylate transport system substrate-binding protein